jgi:hypothetical protein
MDDRVEGVVRWLLPFRDRFQLSGTDQQFPQGLVAVDEQVAEQRRFA